MPHLCDVYKKVFSCKGHPKKKKCPDTCRWNALYFWIMKIRFFPKTPFKKSFIWQKLFKYHKFVFYAIKNFLKQVTWIKTDGCMQVKRLKRLISVQYAWKYFFKGGSCINIYGHLQIKSFMFLKYAIKLFLKKLL